MTKHCINCKSDDLKKAGFSSQGYQRFYCKKCHCKFHKGMDITRIGRHNAFYKHNHSKETKQILHEIFKGRKPWNTGKKKGPTSKSVKQKLSKALRGKTYEQIYGPMKAIEQREKRAKASTIHGQAYAPYDLEFNKRFKRAIRKRDNHVCMLCGIHQEKLYRSLDVHHIDYNKENTLPQNCISLCHSCHALTRLRREYWKTFFQSLLVANYLYKYQDKDIVIDLNKNEI